MNSCAFRESHIYTHIWRNCCSRCNFPTSGKKKEKKNEIKKERSWVWRKQVYRVNCLRSQSFHAHSNFILLRNKEPSVFYFFVTHTRHLCEFSSQQKIKIKKNKKRETSETGEFISKENFSIITNDFLQTSFVVSTPYNKY